MPRLHAHGNPAYGLAALFSVLLICGCAPGAKEPERPEIASKLAYVVYGDDDRQEVYRFDGDAFARASQSLVALVHPELISKLPGGGLGPSPETVAELLQLCADEPFVDQPAVASCSGVLIDNDLVLTAGHCFEGTDRCDGYSYVFDYHYSRTGQARFIGDLDVYGCKRLVVRDKQLRTDGTMYDFAIVQLDHPVDERRRPVPLRFSAVHADEPVIVMGSPQGLPAKIDAGGQVKASPAQRFGFWFADTDTFGGSSGSPAYDENFSLMGILVRGNRDYEDDPIDHCRRAKRIEEGSDEKAQYEQFAYLTPALEALCASDLGGTRSVCAPPPPLEGKTTMGCSMQRETPRRPSGGSLLAGGLVLLFAWRFRLRRSMQGLARSDVERLTAPRVRQREKRKVAR